MARVIPSCSTSCSRASSRRCRPGLPATRLVSSALLLTRPCTSVRGRVLSDSDRLAAYGCCRSFLKRVPGEVGSGKALAEQDRAVTAFPAWGLPAGGQRQRRVSVGGEALGRALQRQAGVPIGFARAIWRACWLRKKAYWCACGALDTRDKLLGLSAQLLEVTRPLQFLFIGVALVSGMALGRLEHRLFFRGKETYG